jgi:hypothetical protein
MKGKAKALIKDYADKNQAVVIHIDHCHRNDPSVRHHYDYTLRVEKKELSIFSTTVNINERSRDS